MMMEQMMNHNAEEGKSHEYDESDDEK